MQTAQFNFMREKDNFDFLRFFASMFVIIGHSYHLLNEASQEPLTRLTGGIYFGALGVYIFFVISGYLVVQSYERNPIFLSFIRNRILRIFPALITAIIFAAFIIGPFVTILSLNDYLSHPDTWGYLESILLYKIHYDLPGVFANNPYPNAVNGSLWVLPILSIMYLILYCYGTFGFIKKRAIILFLHLSVLYLVIFEAQALQQTSIRYIGSGLTLASFYIYFSSGMLYYLYKDHIKLDYGAVLCMLVLWSASFNTHFLTYTSYLFIPYLIMWLAFVPLKFANEFGKYGDFSYGIYVFSFPIQQTINHLFIHWIDPIRLILLTSIIVIPISAISYYLIEAPLLRLKVSHRIKH